jgi:hypothetical protein
MTVPHIAINNLTLEKMKSHSASNIPCRQNNNQIKVIQKIQHEQHHMDEHSIQRASRRLCCTPTQIRPPIAKVPLILTPRTGGTFLDVETNDSSKAKRKEKKKKKKK